MTAKTLFDKIWDSHVVERLDGGDLIHIDRHMIHELTSPRAFDRLAAAGRVVRSPELTFATPDHMVSSAPGRREDTYPKAAPYVRTLRGNAQASDITLFDLDDPRQGIVHVVAPELGLALPGTTLVCGDSHTCTVGGLGVVAFGIGTSDIEHVLATQTLVLRKPRRMRITLDGMPPPGVTAKDLVLHVIATLGAGAGVGHAVEFAGEAVRALPVEGRLTLCNMGIEFSARIAFVAPDDVVFAYLKDRPYAPKGALWDQAVSQWRELYSDPDAVFDRDERLDVSGLAPQVTWGTSPQYAVSVTGVVPDPDGLPEDRRDGARKALAYMGLTPGEPLEGLPVQNVFIGSCTNSRLSDLREAAAVVRGRTVAPGVRALVVPGSTAVRVAAEAEGLDQVFKDAGFMWGEASCSMCVGVNGDLVPRGERCVSTSNRNFEGRQGPGARTHLASPATAAAAAVTGRITDPRRLIGGQGGTAREVA